MLRTPARAANPRSAKKSKYSQALAAKKRGTNKFPTVYIGKQLFPWKLRNTLTYVETITITLTAGAYQQYVMSCNGLYDPNTTGTGHQPRGFDQLTELYNHYTVLNSKCTVTINSASQASAYRAVLFSDDDSSTGITSVDYACERKNAMYTNFDTNAPPKPLYFRYSAKDVFGGDPLSDTNLQGSTNVNPPEGFFYVFGVQDDFLADSGIAVTFKIEYDTVWDELRSFSPS